MVIDSVRRHWPIERAAVAFGLISALLFVFVITFQPINCHCDWPIDEGLYVANAQSLAEGRWLGAFDWRTLAKGPGYSAFLAINYWLGLPITLTLAVFFSAAVGLFSCAITSIARSTLVGTSVFALTLWHPIFLGTRIIRDTIYSGQVYIFLACALVAFFLAEKFRARLMWGALAGIALGWFWLTREEGVWILPAIAVLFTFAILYARAVKLSLQNILIPGIIALSLFLLVQTVFMAGNWWVYGSFVGTDTKERHFVAALDALQSVKFGPPIDLVPVTRVARERIYNVSPAFASLKPHLENFSKMLEDSCTASPAACGEYTAGFFIWALKLAAAQSGYYQNPATESGFFGRLAAELHEACRSGALTCRSSVIPYMPHLSWFQIKQIPDRVVQAITLVSRPHLIGSVTPQSSGNLSDALIFLNYPPHIPSAGGTHRIRLSGWYYSKDGIWPRFKILKPGGDSVPITLQINTSPDIASYFGDPRATSNRFTIETYCDADCTLSIQRGDGTELRPLLRSLLMAGPTSGAGDGTFFVDQAEMKFVQSDIRMRASSWIKRGVLAAYNLVLPFVLGFGALAFIAAATLGFLRRSGDVLLAVAATAWILVVSRIILLVVVDISAFSAVDPTADESKYYMMPVLYLSVTASVLSIADLHRSLRSVLTRFPSQT